MQQRFPELDAIRGVAALMVVLYHYTVRYGQIYADHVAPAFALSVGQHGVDLFFMVSGFVIFLTLDKTRHGADFLVSRLSRLYPAYWVAIALTFAVVHIWSLPGREVGGEAALVNLTMLQLWFQVPHVDGVYWTLELELSFYVIMYALFATGLIKRIHAMALLWMAAVLGVFLLERHGVVQVSWVWKTLFLLDFANLFIAGIMFYKLKREPIWQTYAVIALALASECFMHRLPWWLLAANFSLFFLFAKGHLGWLDIRPLTYLGAISYSLYLVHQNIGYVVIQSLQAHGMANAWSVVIAPLAAALGLASLMYRYVEQPSLALIRRVWGNSVLRQRLRM